MTDSQTNRTDLAAEMDAKAHFLHNIAQINNSAVLLTRHPDGTLETIFVSQAFADMMECSVEEAMRMMNGISFYKSTDPEDRPLVRSMLKNRVAYDGSNTITVQKISAKKNKIWCNINYSFIDDFDEHYIYCTYTDVTAHKQYENRLRTTYSSFGNNFYQVNDRTLALFRVNLTRDRFEEIKGKDPFDTDSVVYTYSEALRQRSAHFPIRNEKKQLLQQFGRDRLIAGYLEGRSYISSMFYSVRRDGHACFVTLTASLTRHPLSGDLIAFMTEQECNDVKVKETLTDKILAQQFDMVCYLADGRYGVTIGRPANVKRGNIFPATSNGIYRVYLNNQVYPVLHGTEEEKAAMRRHLSMEAVTEALKTQDSYMVDIAIEIEGEVYYKQFDFYNVDPDAEFYIMLKSDTTELQKQHRTMNEQLMKALEAANQANVAKTAFLSSMSHEIRTPMNAIIGLNSIALSEPGLNERTREHLEKIGSSARHLLSLINNILDMSRIESGRMALSNEEFSFPGMLEEINTMISSQCREKNIRYECHVRGHVDDYYIGDVMKLKQVLINILGNAVKFTPESGSVSFEVEKMAELGEQSEFVFRIQDTGVGIDAAYLPRIFEPFSQENSVSTGRFGSTGLGLAITKNIVELMNGTISVESQKGAGSAFTVAVPLRNSARRSRAADDIRLQDLRVLVIDDDPIACEHARIVLEEAGVSAEVCESGQRALEMIRLKSARREGYNLILVDWKMPEKDGVKVTREIRDLIGFGTAVIMLTAYTWDDIETEARLAGVDAFMAKPLFASNVMSSYSQIAAQRRLDEKEIRKAELSGRRILLAEDIDINAIIIKEMLKMRGVEVDHAENGQEAVDMFEKHPSHYYDAVLMDLRMPVMDGLEAARIIRESDHEDSKLIPIIALTANAFDEDVQQTLRAGMNAHLSKPVEPQQVYDTLEELIRI